MKYLIFFFSILVTTSIAQSPMGVDSLMLKNNIKTKTQWICNSKGEDCKPEIVWLYNQDGTLNLKQSFRNDSLIETNRYEYNAKQWATKVYTRYGEGKEFLNIKYTYDTQSRLTLFEACYGDGRCEPFEKYIYNPNGKLLTRIRYKDGKYFYEYRHKYDTKGNNIEILILSKDSDSGEREKKKYDSKGHHTSSLWIDYRGNEIDQAQYTYDDSGRLLEHTWIGGLSTKKLYEYDTLGNNTKYTAIDYNGQIEDLREMKYDGHLIQERIKFEGKKIESFWKFTYETWQ